MGVTGGLGVTRRAVHREEHEPDDDQGQRDETDDDPGEGQAVSGLRAVRLADLAAGHESEDDAENRADAAQAPDEADDERRDGQAVRADLLARIPVAVA